MKKMEKESKEIIRDAWKQVIDVVHENKQVLIIPPEEWTNLLRKMSAMENRIKEITESRDNWKKRYSELKDNSNKEGVGK